MAEGAGYDGLSRSLPQLLGALPAPCRRGCALRADAARRRQSRPARRSRPSKPAREAVDRAAAAGAVRLLASCISALRPSTARFARAQGEEKLEDGIKSFPHPERRSASAERQ